MKKLIVSAVTVFCMQQMVAQDGNKQEPVKSTTTQTAPSEKRSFTNKKKTAPADSSAKRRQRAKTEQPQAKPAENNPAPAQPKQQ